MHYSLTRATAWNLSGYIYLLIASFIATPILVDSLGITQFAQYSLIIAALTFVSSINIGLPQAVVRQLTLSRTRAVWATSSLLFILTGLLAGLVACTLLITCLPASPSGGSLLTYLIIFSTALLNNLLSHYLTLPQAEGHFGYFNLKSFIIGSGNTLLAAFLAYNHSTISMILAFQLLTYLLTLLPLAYFSLYYFPRPWENKASLPMARSLLSFGAKSWLGKLAGQLQAQYAKYLLISISSLSLSAYVIAQGLVIKAAGGVVQLATAIYPASTSSNIRRLYYKLQFSLLFIGVLVYWCFGMFGLSFLTWWLHSSELVAMIYPLLKILLWYFLILILTPLPSTIIEGRGFPGIASSFAVVTVAIEIILALILLPFYGLYAPVYASLIAILITTPFLLYKTEMVLKSTI